MLTTVLGLVLAAELTFIAVARIAGWRYRSRHGPGHFGGSSRER